VSVAARYQTQVMENMMVAPGVDLPSHAALGLAGEAGEVADIVKKSQYAVAQPVDREKLLLELGDALWYLTYIAGHYGLTLEEVMAANIGKLERRHPLRTYSVARLIG
jgi:NTP pyrophosphatase (non-canonical NTP hydrolase)